ncbi:hypothetical protein BBO99_00001492 [Phytophthora kernoviae]|uniref:Uncharacterized protein n=2 Tax=Phytophthora kernoviae TaxID=325452 RepID=A0A421F2U7_9STRA|nr:hypothetical protein G195_005394 [Phytophthora kernoviae 00238/432]KAG2526734.1 hypothetical protein JM18_004270 [Phytophthora kernoviae]KAG2531382.1 hypothetical protein JM16_001126 [Phytophthora kernoviae]RLN20350.1 hypothetical protein BBI17_001315 [Phytophthora kernoviae]RLN84218.1 hypothetical protein BBO99_00001492 [Phytophthora kernoviae]
MEAYTDESDVFEEDIESILYQEAQVDRRKGFTDCLLETHLDTTEYPYPAYLAKLSTLFTDESAFGKNPEKFIYCNNLLLNHSQLAVLDERTAALESDKLNHVRKVAAMKAKEAKRKRREERRMETRKQLNTETKSKETHSASSNRDDKYDSFVKFY